MATEQTFGVDPSSLRIYEARFGDKDGALALLKYPLEMREFFLRLSDKADLPDSAPAGAVWEPFVRGWRQDDYYMIALTEADHLALRPGMIATRMFAVALSEAEKWNDLGALFESLIEKDRVYASELVIPSRPTQSPQTVAPAQLACVAHHLIREDKPVAILGQNAFQALIAALWQKLPPELRQTFGFGFSFTPADLTVAKASIVAVPMSCEARWSTYKFKCDVTWDHPLSDAVVAFLSDAQSHGFLEFLAELGLVFQSFSDYGRYTRLWSYWQKRGENDPEITRALLRSLGTLLPAPYQGVTQKEEAMRIATGVLKDGTEEDILALRSIKAGAFPSDAKELERAVWDWLKRNINSSQAQNRAGLSSVLLALPTSQSAEWQAWVRKGLKQEFAVLSESAAHTIWSVWEGEGALAEITAQLPNDAGTERALLQACPTSLPAKLFSPLAKWCIGRGWICLLARAAYNHLGFAKAMDLVFKQNEGKQRTAAIELLCEAGKPSEVWLSAFKHDDLGLIERAVAAAKAEPTLWNTADVAINRWVALLEFAAKSDPRLLRAIDANIISSKLFEAWSKGAPVTEVVCAALENAGLLEFSLCPDRKSLWLKIPKPYLANSLSNTLRAWLKDYYSRGPVEPVLEKELVQILFAPEHSAFTLPRNSPHIALGGLLLVEAAGSEHDCESWLNAVMASGKELGTDVANQAGKVIAERHWVSLAKTIKYLDERKGRQDFRVIWQACYNSLGRIERFLFDYLPGNARPSQKSLTPTETLSMIDAVFVTALPEEFNAVRAHLSNFRELTEYGSIYEIGNFENASDQFTVAVVQTGMGNSLSAAATERAMTLFKPDFAFFVGIAGGLRDDLRVGDVVAASKVYGYESGKSGATFQPRPEAPPVSHEAEQRANAVVRDSSWHKRISPTPQVMPIAIVRPIAAGEKVLVSEASEDLKRVRATFTDAHAVAMEDIGFATAVRAHPKVCFAVVRGISDLIENKQEADSSGSHEIAARNAAAFAFEMLAGLIRGRASNLKGEGPVEH